jgi:hypothetical protein
MKKATSIAAVMLYAAFSTGASAQTVYRCGNAYSEKPCPGATSFEASDPRSGEQAAAASEKARRDAKLAGEMQKDRIAEEKRLGGPAKMILGLPPAEPAHAASGSKKHARKKHKGEQEPADFSAVGPKKPKPKKS